MYSVSASPTDVSDGKPEENCKAIDEKTGENCGETGGLQILDEFQRLYKARIEKIDHESAGELDRASMKLQIMTEWVKDLGEQNVMLVHTVEDLEQAACSRVKLLEEKLKQSSRIVSENMAISNHSEETLNILSNRVSQLEKDEDYLHQKIEFLQSDIRGLLELIRRGRRENCWDLDGITFFEIQPSDIPAPLDCSCGQEQLDSEYVPFLKTQIKQLQENEKKASVYQTDLEEKLKDLKTQLSLKEETVKKYISKFQCLNNNLKKHSNLSNQITFESGAADFQADPDIILTPDIVDSVLIEKDLEIKSLCEQLKEMKSKWSVLSRENNTDQANLKVQLEEKSKELQEIEQRMVCLQKESLETREALTAEVAEKHDIVMSLRKEVATLEEQCRHANMQIHFKDDIIKEMRKELKQANVKDSSTRKVHINTNTFQEKHCISYMDSSQCSNKDSELPSNIKNCHQDKILSYLVNTKLLMEKEKEALFDLKIELEKILEKLNIKEGKTCEYDMINVSEKLREIETLLKNYKTQVIDHSESAESLKDYVVATEFQLNCLQSIFQNKCAIRDIDKNEICINNITGRLANNIENIAKMCSEKEKAITLIDCMMKTEKCNYVSNESRNIAPNPAAIEQFKLMEEFRVCTVEAQAAIEDVREEIVTVISNFNMQHQKYTQLSEIVVNMQDYLSKTREGILETINRLQLHEEERSRQNERIANGKIKLKDIKNEINHVQSQLSYSICNMQTSLQESNILGYTEACSCNDLLSLAVDEIEQILLNLQLFQKQGCCATSTLSELKNVLLPMEYSLNDLKKQMDEVLLENEVAQTVFCQREKKLEKLEDEVDCAHTKMQDVLEIFLSSKEQGSMVESTFCNYTQCQATNEVVKAKEDFYKLRKEYDALQFKMLQEASQTKYDERINQWKYCIADLQDQINILKHEAKCKEEANDFLKNSIESMEKELSTVKTKADNYRRCHSVDSVELKKKILELENILKSQKEVECHLRTSLTNSETELMKSKELLNSLQTECNTEGNPLRCGYQYKYENVPHLFKTLQDALQHTKNGFKDLAADLKQLICESSSHSCTSTRSIITLIDKLASYEEKLDNCFQEIEKLKTALCSKDKLLENMDEIIRIQKNSITMTQSELKDLHQRLQEKIDMQDQIISQYEKEKNELLKQNELQVQTIGHLQNAVVEAKRCLDHMGHKTMSDLHEKDETIHTLTLYVDETQSQYNECFAEAAEQDGLMELQRDAIEFLQEKVNYMEYEKHLISNLLHSMYYSVLNIIQEQLQTRVSDFEALKCKMDALLQSKYCLENKYTNVKKLWQEANKELQILRGILLIERKQSKSYESKMCQCKIDVENKCCSTEDLAVTSSSGNSSDRTQDCSIDFSHEHELQAEIAVLISENQDMKNQLKKYEADLELFNSELKIEKENDICFEQLKIEIDALKDVEYSLKSENQKLNIDLEKRGKETEDLIKKLDHVREQEITLEKRIVELEVAEGEIKNLYSQVTCNETVIREQSQIIEELQRKLEENDQQTARYVTELNVSKDAINSLYDQICSLKIVLKEKSMAMSKLQVDYEVLKNENSIVRTENSVFENKAKEDILQLKDKVKTVQSELYIMEDNYQRATQDYNKTQEQLIETAKREAHLQESFTAMEKDYCCKLANVEREETKLGELVNKLNDELENIQKKLSLKNAEVHQVENLCKSYVDQLDVMHQSLEEERARATNTEDANRCLMQQLREYIDENHTLSQQKTLLEQNNCKHIAELQDMYTSLMELKKECQLKNKSLACMSAELTQTAMSRSELCNESQYMVTCIRTWMEEQRKLVETLASKLRIKQQQLMQIGFEKKALLMTVRELRRINNLLTQRMKRNHRPVVSRNVKSMCMGSYIVPSYTSQTGNRCSIGPIRTARRTSVCGSSWWFPKMEYLTNELRKNNEWWNKNLSNRTETDTTLDESRDCGYQSSTSK